MTTRWRGFRSRRAAPSLPPKRWLHCRQMMRTLSMRSWPPRACGCRWSTSGDCGVLVRVQSKRVLQSGQFVWSFALALRSALVRRRFHLAVPVREVAKAAPHLMVVQGVRVCVAR